MVLLLLVGLLLLPACDTSRCKDGDLRVDASEPAVTWLCQNGRWKRYENPYSRQDA